MGKLTLDRHSFFDRMSRKSSAVATIIRFQIITGDLTCGSVSLLIYQVINSTTKSRIPQEK